MRHERGFTLIELVIALAIIGILVSTAIPSIREYRIKTNRSAAKAAILELASREKQYFIDAKKFLGSATCSATVLGYTPSSDVSEAYCITITVNNAAPPEFLIKAVPELGSIQEGDGDLTLNHYGTKTGKW